MRDRGYQSEGCRDVLFALFIVTSKFDQGGKERIEVVNEGFHVSRFQANIKSYFIINTYDDQEIVKYIIGYTRESYNMNNTIGTLITILSDPKKSSNYFSIKSKLSQPFMARNQDSSTADIFIDDDDEGGWTPSSPPLYEADLIHIMQLDYQDGFGQNVTRCYLMEQSSNGIEISKEVAIKYLETTRNGVSSDNSIILDLVNPDSIFSYLNGGKGY